MKTPEQIEEFLLSVFDSRGTIKFVKDTYSNVPEFDELFDADGFLRDEFHSPLRQYMVRINPPCYSDATRLFYGLEMQSLTGQPAKLMWKKS